MKKIKIALAASFALLVLISLMSTEKAQAASSVIDNPTHVMDGTWTAPASTSDDHTIKSVSADITPLTDNPTDGYFYAAEVYYSPSSVTGYMGLQNNGTNGNNQTVPKTASVTIYGAISASPASGVVSGCYNHGEGPQCNLNYTYDWVAGHTYRFNLSLKTADDGKGNSVWASKFSDTTTGNIVELGTLNVLVSQKYLSHTVTTFHERFSGPTDNCSSIKPSFVTFSNVIMDGASATASSTFGHIGNISGCPGYLDNYLLNKVIYSGFGPNIKSYEPSQPTPPTPPPTLVSAEVSPNVDKLIKQFVSDNSAGGAPGVIFKDLGGGNDNAANADISLTAASLYKLFVAYNLYSQRAGGSLSFAQKIPLVDVAGQWEENKRDCKASSDTDPCVSAIWPSKPLGQSASVDDCLPKMIIYSDNICGATFLDYGRTHGLYNLLSAEGYSHTSLAPGSLQTSPSDVAKLLTLIAQNKLVSAADSQEIYGLMLKQAHRAKIPAGIPSLKVANKTGEIHDSSAPKSHDAAIVEGSGKTYVLVVMTHLNPDSPTDDAKIATLASQIFNQTSTASSSENCTSVSSSGPVGNIYQQLQWPFYSPGGNSSCSSSCSAVGNLPAVVPAPYNEIFTAAGTKFNVSPAFIAAMFYGGEHGNSFPDPPPPYGHGSAWADSGVTGSNAPWPGGIHNGAAGPFQFEYPAWTSNGIDGNGDGIIDVEDLTDASFGAAKFLAGLGAGSNTLDQATLRKAAGNYNGSGPNDSYANNVWEAFVKFSGAASSSPATTTNTCASGDISAYKTPFRNIKNLSASRIDQGIDYQGTGEVYPIGDGIIDVSRTDAGWPGGNFISYTLLSGPAHDKEVYIAENCRPKPGISPNVKVYRDRTPLCDMTTDGIEIGWAGKGIDNAIDKQLEPSCYDKSSSTSTTFGMNFQSLMKALGVNFDPHIDLPNTCTMPGDWPKW